MSETVTGLLELNGGKYKLYFSIVIDVILFLFHREIKKTDFDETFFIVLYERDSLCTT